MIGPTIHVHAIASGLMLNPNILHENMYIPLRKTFDLTTEMPTYNLYEKKLSIYKKYII